MGLYLPKELDNGVTGSYWRVTETNIDFARKQSKVSITLYIDKDARLNNKEALMSIDYNWNDDEFPFRLDHIEIEDIKGNKIVPLNLTDDNPVALSYKVIKTFPEFEGAVDC